MKDDKRLQELRIWLNNHLGSKEYDLTVASADASFRRYFRIKHNNRSMIAMDAPPAQEDCRPFVEIAKLLLTAKINVPEILAEDYQQGYLLLSDLGDTQYLSILNDANVNELYKDAIDSLIKIQTTPSTALPRYDRKLLETEMSLFPDWFIAKHLKINLSNKQQQLLDGAFECLVENALQQPEVFVHRDFHSRNLMHSAISNPGILDFQDAVSGAVAYDLASLLKDCYITWPRQQIEQWVRYYLQQAHKNNLVDKQVDFTRFIQWFDLIAVQRHLKVLGIFIRLNIRDNKSAYMDDLPRVFNYVAESCDRYPVLYPLKTLLQELEIAEKLGIDWPKL